MLTIDRRSCYLAMREWRAALIVLFLLAFAAAVWAQTSDSKPVKLAIRTDQKATHAGEAVKLEVTMLDAKNNAAQVPEETTVNLSAKANDEAAPMNQESVTIDAGQTSAAFEMTFDREGVIEVWARHANLLDGNIFLNIKPPRDLDSEEEPAEEEVVPPDSRPRSPITTQLAPKITLRYSPQRKLLADGQDGALVQAFLLDAGDESVDNIQVRLFHSGGKMEPVPLSLPVEEGIGTSTLTSDQIETIEVEFVSASPDVQVDGDKKLTVEFGPPISELVIDASPPSISLVESAEIVVKLQDVEGKPVATDQERQIGFEIDAGRGVLEQTEVTIQPGSFKAQTSFTPTWRGEVALSASTPHLLPATATLQVTLPTILLILSAVGGLAGGFVAYWRQESSSKWRIVVGLATGFVLYWAFVFGVLPVIPKEFVLNPLSSLAISILGGWLGTEAFSIVLKRLGLISG